MEEKVRKKKIKMVRRKMMDLEAMEGSGDESVSSME